MTAEEILADLRERCDRAIQTLEGARQNGPQIPYSSPLRLIGKIDGIKLVRDWLRSYSTEAAPHMTSAEEYEAAGYVVDRSCYPWVAYKGLRFKPMEWHYVDTPQHRSSQP